MSYNYSYKSSSTGGSAMPRTGLSNDADFQSAKMQAMMGAPLQPTSSLGTDAEMDRMKREMERSLHKPSADSGCDSSNYSYSSKSTSGGTSPRSVYVHQEPTNTSGGSTVKKVVTTTTTKTNPQATREFEGLERDFNRIGRTPDDYQDDFDKLRREISTGEAYRGGTVGHEPVSMKLREEHLRSTPSHIGSSLGGGGNSETKTTTTRRSFGSGQPITEETVTRTSNSGSHSQPESIGAHGEVYIPVKSYDNTFDDFHMNRWLDHRDNFGSIAAPELDGHKMDWENRLRGKKADMFTFSPHSDFGNSHVESSRTVAKNPLGKPEFSVQFDMRDFKAEDINLTTKLGKLIISATHEDKIGNSTSRREFTRSVDLPADVQVNLMRSVFSRDGVLSITAPIKPPHYDPLPKQLSPPLPPLMSATQQFTSPGQGTLMTSTFDAPLSSRSNKTHQSSIANYNSQPRYSSNPSSPNYYDSQTSHTQTGNYGRYNNEVALPDEAGSILNYTLPVSGYSPDEIDVSVEGCKVKVHGKHVQNRVGGRKTHNEFTKMFDLPSNVRPENVRSYVKDGHTLHVIAHLADDVQGAVHFIPVIRKW